MPAINDDAEGGQPATTLAGKCSVVSDFAHVTSASDCAYRSFKFVAGDVYDFEECHTTVRFSPGWVVGYAVRLPDGAIARFLPSAFRERFQEIEA